MFFVFVFFKLGMNEMEIEEISSAHGLKTNVLYFTPPDEDFPSLVRSTTFTNLDSKESLDLDILGESYKKSCHIFLFIYLFRFSFFLIFFFFFQC